MSWQRRTCEIPAVRDLTNEEPGTSYVWDLRAVVKCAACGRPGVLSPKAKLTKGIETIVAHSVDDEGALMDYCVEAEFVPGSPRHVCFDREGNITGEFYPTTAKVDSSN